MESEAVGVRMGLREALQRHWRDAREVFAQPGRRNAAQLAAAAKRAEHFYAQSDGLDDRALLAACSACRADLIRATRLGGPEYDLQRSRAVALIAVAAVRFIGFGPTREQLSAALAMHEGYAVDMPTGSGKTLAVACCAILHVWSGRRCHVAVASEKFAERDAHAMGRLFAMTDCSVGWLGAETPRERIQQIYSCDIVYATARQLLADHMRDRSLLGNTANPLRRQLWTMRQAAGEQGLLMGELAAAVVDDIDRVLLDEALSPLVISAAGDYSVLDQATVTAAGLVEQLQPERHYRIDYLPVADIVFTEAGRFCLEELAQQLPPFWRHPRRSEDLLATAIIAREVLQPERHYALREGKVILTGDGVQSLLGSRAWYFGVLQALEARAGLELTPPPRTVARIVFQEFFPLYHYLSGTGSMLAGLAPELKRFYQLQTLTVGSASKRAVLRHQVFTSREEKLPALAERALQLHRQGLPVVVFAAYAADMEAIAVRLVDAGIAVQAVLGMNPEQDLVRVQQAGQPGAVTMMTIGAARGTSIAVSEKVAAAGGLQALLCGHQDLRRLDELIAGKVGGTEVFVSLQDDILVRALPFWARPLHCLAGWLPARAALTAMLVRLAQHATQRHLARHRLLLLKREEQLDQQLAFSRKN